MGCSGDKNVFSYAAIDCWPYPESNPIYVLSRASLNQTRLERDGELIFRIGFPELQDNTASIGFNPCLSV